MNPYLCVFYFFFECSSAPVNSMDCDNFQISEEKKDLEEEGNSEAAANGPRQILPYSSMFVFGQTNPWVTAVRSGREAAWRELDHLSAVKSQGAAVVGITDGVFVCHLSVWDNCVTMWWTSATLRCASWWSSLWAASLWQLRILYKLTLRATMWVILTFRQHTHTHTYHHVVYLQTNILILYNILYNKIRIIRCN